MKVCKVCGREWPETSRFCPSDGNLLSEDGASLPSPIEILNSLIGQVLNRTYKIEAKLGQGGMGAVFRAKHLGIGDTVALKVISPEHTKNETTLMRFRREAQASRRLAHPNAVAVHDFNTTEDGLLFMVMEYVDGETVEKYLKQHAPLKPKRALEILKPVAAALDVAHSLGIVHRDLKPANLMLSKDPTGQEKVKVLDFGTARLQPMEDQPDVSITQQGQIFGTPVYMSPEQVMGEPTSASSDVYSLGVILYEMLTGRVPFIAPKSLQIMMAHVHQQPELPSQRQKELPKEFDSVILRALEKESENRYQTAGALIEHLGEVVVKIESTKTASIHSGTNVLSSPLLVDRQTLSSTSSTKTRPQTLINISLPVASGSIASPDMKLSRVKMAALFEPEFDQYVGRESELKRLQSIYEDTIEGKSRQVFITGSPGMGKTQTLVRFREWLFSKDALVLIGKFLDYGAKTTDALKLFKTLLSGHIPTGVLKSIAAVSASWTDENLLEESEDASTEKWQAFEQLMTSFTSIAKVRPVVIMLDDLQWAEALSLEFLGFLLRNTEHLPFFFIGTSRAEEAETKGNPFREWLVGQSRYLHYEKIVLQPFNKDKINQLLQSIFQFIEVSQKDIEVLFDLTGGNPFYLTEVIRLLLDNKKIFFQENVWHGSEFDEINLPDTISNVIRYKLETCPEELRSLLSTASVLGDDFSFQLLEEVTDLSEIDLEKLLATAVKLKLLCEDKEETDEHYRFYNTTIRKVIYDDISKRQKKRIHGRVAEALLKTSKGKTRSIDNALAYHYFMSADWEKAYQYSTEALKHAIRKQSIDEVLRLSGYAEEALTNLVEESGETLDKPGERQKIIGQLKIRKATAIMRLGRFEEANREAEEMKEFIDALGDKTLQAKRALVQLELCYWSNRHAEGVLIGTEGVKLAKAAGDDECTRYILYHLAWCQARISKIDTAIQIFKEVERASEEAKDLTLQARALCGLGQLVHYSGEWQQARIYMEKGRECATAIGDRFAEAQVLMHYSWILTYEGNSGLLLKLADEAVKIDRTCDWRNWEAYNYFVIGRHYVHNLIPNLELAEEYLSRSLSIFKETNDQGGQLIVSPELVQLEFLTNPSNEVLDKFRNISAILTKFGERLINCETLCLLGEGEQLLGQWNSSHTTFERALEMAKTTPHIDCQWRAHYGLAKFFKQQTEEKEAFNHITSAIAIINRLQHELDSPEEIALFMENKEPVYSTYAEWCS